MADLQTLRNDLTVARSEVSRCLEDLGRAQTELAQAKADLEAAVSDARFNGQIEGKNEADREAHARQLFPELHTRVLDGTLSVAQTKADLDVALNELERYRDELRIAEIEAQIPFAQAA